MKFFLCLFFAYAYAEQKYVSTPHGKRLKECVMSFPKASIVEELANGDLGVEYPNGTMESFTPPPQCHEDMARMMKERENGPNAWLDNAGWYPPGRDMSKFTGDYVVPAGDPQRGGATLYYFIGMQNNGDGPVNILQPVLAYQGEGWSYTSWICCPSNISTTGNRVRTEAGAKLGGSIVRTGSDTWDVEGTASGGTTSLKQRVGPYKYSWADVTMEQYSYSQCSQSPKGPISFQNMKLYDSSGKSLNPTPNDWSTTGRTMCSGTLKVLAGDHITIEHSTS